MKIAIFHNLPPGGGKRVLYEQVKYLSSVHETHLYETEKQKKFLDAGEFSNKKYLLNFDLKNRLPGILNRLYKDYKNFIKLNNHHKQISGIIDDGNYDVCVIHPDRFTQTPFILRYLKTPTLYFCEEYLRICYEKQLIFNEPVIFYKKWYEFITRIFRKRIDKTNAMYADKVVANSKYTKENIDEAYGITSRFCHLGVNAKIFRKTTDSKRNMILVIGEKDVTGDYPFIKILSELIKKYGIKIKTLGFSKGRLEVSDDNILAGEYSSAIATVCVSFNEPFGLAPLESMACETPVLAVNEGGYRETINDGITGYLLPREPRVFAKKIIYLLDNPDILKKMGKMGREHVKRYFTWEKHCKCLEKYLIDVAKDKRVLKNEED